jgi:serine/threonine protein kinase
MTKRRDLEEGTLFQKKYRIGKKLGEGGMGVVYAAVQEPSGLPVAIKVISARELSARDLQAERAFREARVLAKLTHNNIVRLYDFDQTAEGDCFIVMELVEGDSLHTLIQRARKQGTVLDLRDALRFVLQAAEGVGAAHKAGIIHRDLKPDNMMVSIGGIVRVLDFGLAKNQSANPVPPSGVATNPVNTPGTPRYMAPEQVRGDEIDARTDIYSLGVTLYETLTGRPPYEREHDDDQLRVTEVMSRHCFAKPTPLTKHLPNCPEGVVRIVLRCLAKDPADRYQTTRELALDLRTALADVDQAEQAKEAARKAHPTMQVARETGPMPQQWNSGPVLPFVPAAASLDAHVVRNTIPMQAEAGRAPQPTYSASQSATPPAQRGVGFTTKMTRPSESELAAAESQVRAGALCAAPQPGIQAGGEGAGMTQQSVTSGIRLRPAPSAEPGPAAEEVAKEQPMPRPQPRDHRAPKASGRAWRVPPIYIAPILGGIGALMAVIVLMEVRSQAHGAPRGDAPTPVPATSQAPGGNTASAPPEVAAVAEPADGGGVTRETATTTAPAADASSVVSDASAPPQPPEAPLATSRPRGATVVVASTAVPQRTLPVGPTPKATASAAQQPADAPAERRTGRRPIMPPPAPSDEVPRQSKKRPITPPRPDDQPVKRSAPLFGVDQ